MHQILHLFRIDVSAGKVFDGFTTPEGLDQWWTKSSSGTPEPDSVYQLHFGAGYDWTAVVTKCIINKEFEWEITTDYPDWHHTKIGFVLHEKNNKTTVQFYHSGWQEENEQFRGTSYCWAMYLRILKRYLESGERVAYEKRLSV